MTINLLEQIAGSRLPALFYRPEDIERIRALRAAGLVVAMVPSPSEPRSPSGPAAAQVLAVTEKGREELAKFSYPEARPVRWKFRVPRIGIGALAAWQGTTAPVRDEAARPH